MKYNSIAYYFSENMHFDIWGFDTWGFGKSEGRRGYLDGDI